MVSYDYAYLEQRAVLERDCAERAGNPYVRACHKRLAKRYEQAIESLQHLPSDWQDDLVARI